MSRHTTKPTDASQTVQRHYVTRSVKEGVYRETLEEIRQELTPKELFASKIIHNQFSEPVLESLEVIFSKRTLTLSLSAGLMAGTTTALLFSILLSIRFTMLAVIVFSTIYTFVFVTTLKATQRFIK